MSIVLLMMRKLQYYHLHYEYIGGRKNGTKRRSRQIFTLL